MTVFITAQIKLTLISFCNIFLPPSANPSASSDSKVYTKYIHFSLSPTPSTNQTLSGLHKNLTVLIFVSDKEDYTSYTNQVACIKKKKKAGYIILLL